MKTVNVLTASLRSIYTAFGFVAFSASALSSPVIYPIQKIVDTQPDDYALYGSTVDADGNKFIASDIRYFDSGQVDYYIKNNQGTWVKRSDIPAPAIVNDHGYTDVALSGRRAVFGSSLAWNHSGEAYYYSRDNSGNWTLQQSMEATNDWSSDSHFANALEMSGNNMLIGARAANSTGNWRSGSLYFYTFRNGLWELSTHINNRNDGAGNNTLLGWAVGISGWHAMATARTIGDDRGSSLFYGKGGTYFFARNGAGEWRRTQLIEPTDHTAEDPGSYGETAAMAGNFAFVGANTTDSGENLYVGQVHVYQRQSNGQWQESQIIESPVQERNVRFGTLIEAKGDTLLISGPGANSIYVYKPDNQGQWQEVATLTLTEEDHQGRQNNSDPSYKFGSNSGSVGEEVYSNLSISGNYAIIGDPYYDVTTAGGREFPWAGAVFIFDLSSIN